MTALILLLVIASITYWILRLSSDRILPTLKPPVEAAVLIDSASVARLLGAKTATTVMQASLASRFVLRGVVAGSPQGGAALISVDGKPAQTIRVGTTVSDNLVLQSVTGRQAVLGTALGAPALATLDMPALKN